MFSRALAVIALIASVRAIGTPFGHAEGTTGGGSAPAQTPSSLDELKAWLDDDVPRTIVLDRIFDYTNYDGTISGTACAPWSCKNNPQLAINANGWCGSNPATTKITYSAAGGKPLYVKSNKTLLGKGKNAGLKGKGIKIVNAKNVIVQNIRITDINPRFVWGGDAIQIADASNIWIDHNYVQNIGRQMIVTGFGSVTKTTISYNLFYGVSPYSTGCDGKHYWTALFAGTKDELTFAYNSVSNTAGRGPHIGGLNGDSPVLHMYNNYFVSISGHALDPDLGSKVLAEGNYFNTVRQPVTGGTGQAFMPLDDAAASKCQQTLGRKCVPNKLLASGNLNDGQETGAISAFSSAVYKNAKVVSADEAAQIVSKQAGVGVIN